jgi:aminopeptidase YwaD
VPTGLVSGFISFVFLITLFIPVKPQVLPYARMVVDTLSSPAMHGRGYVHDGHTKAASFIAGEFKKMQLQSFGNGFFQEFEISVNTFPASVEMSVGDTEFEAGSDFLVTPCSQTIIGEFPTLYLHKKEILDSPVLLNRLQEARGKVLVIDQELFTDAPSEEQQKLHEVLAFLRQFKNNPASAILFLSNDKLTWHVAQQPCETPQVTVKRSLFPEEADSVALKIENKFLNKLNTQNVVGLVQGKNPGKDIMVYSAHYDHLGRLGQDAYFPGANDNASGVAMLLSLARHYSRPENQPEQSILFIAFGAEEVGLLGSRHFVKNPLVPLEKIDFLINLDITGTGDEGIKVVNGKIYEQEFEQLKTLNQQHELLPEVSARGEACNSDHCFFHEAGVPSFFIYTLGGIQAYHDVDDKASTLPLTKFEELFELLTLFTKTLPQ